MQSAHELGATILDVSTFGCNAADELEPQALGLTYWFAADETGPPYPATIQFVGHRVGFKGKPGTRDRFSVVETIDRVIPGSGPIAVTTRISDIAAGEWHVSAGPGTVRGGRKLSGSRPAQQPSLPKAASSGRTAFAPVIGGVAPGAHLGAWPALVGAGVVVALSTQAILAHRADLAVTPILWLSLFASVIGLVGAKLYFLAERRGPSRGLVTAGMCIQGFVIGAIGTLIIGALQGDVPVGRVLDLTAAGLLFGMAIGRLGCFFGGCCAGRPTASRWGLWSSDRHIGVRRIPTQLVEALVALLIGVAAFLSMWIASPKPYGVVFIAAIAAYTLGRQAVFPFRELPRKTHRGRMLTMAIAGSVFVVDVAMAVLH